MKRLGLLFVAVVTLGGLWVCTAASEWCSNPENAKAHGGYEDCIKARKLPAIGTY